MRPIFFMLCITVLFFVLGTILKQHWIEALPIALIGGCLGWAIMEFKRETYHSSQE